MKELKNQIGNEIFRQMSLALTLPLDVPVRPMDAEGLSHKTLRGLTATSRGENELLPQSSSCCLHKVNSATSLYDRYHI